MFLFSFLLLSIVVSLFSVLSKFKDFSSGLELFSPKLYSTLSPPLSVTTTVPSVGATSPPFITIVCISTYCGVSVVLSSSGLFSEPVRFKLTSNGLVESVPSVFDIFKPLFDPVSKSFTEPVTIEFSLFSSSIFSTSIVCTIFSVFNVSDAFLFKFLWT